MNSENHPKEEGDKEAHALDYDSEVRKMAVSKWRNLVDYPVVFEHRLERREIRQLLEAMQVSIPASRFSSIHEEEMEEIIHRLEVLLPDTTTGWFFRLDECAPKDGVFGHGWSKIRTARDVVLQLVTSNRARLAIESGNDVLYFCHVIEKWDHTREVRVFVRGGEVTAISQYTCESPWLCSRTDAQLEVLGFKLVQALTDNMSQIGRMLNTFNFVCDILIKDDTGENLYFIEFNPCGYWLPTGSSFFHWIYDRNLLYNKEGDVYFRVGIITPPSETICLK